MTSQNISFTAHVITGSGRGKSLGIPTLNLALEDIPEELEEGIYACFVVQNEKRLTSNDQRFPAVMHYGPRPVFNDSKSCELHFLQGLSATSYKPQTLTVEVVERIREVRDFESEEMLKEEMQRDIAKARAILGAPHE